MRLYSIPEGGDGTEYVVMAETPADAIAKCEAYRVAQWWQYLAEHPEPTVVERTFEWYAGNPPLYLEIEEISDVYPVPMYGYSW